MQDKKEKLASISNYFGVSVQETKMIEELGELTTALSRLQQEVLMVVSEIQEKDENRINKLMENVIEELADVDILKDQLIEAYDAREEFDEAVEYKIKRTLIRIGSGYYGKYS